MRRRFQAAIATINLAIVLLSVSQPAAQAEGLRVFASDGVKEVLKALLPQIQRETGQSIHTEYNTSVALKRRIDSGEQFDIAILSNQAIDELVKEGTIASASRANVGRSEIGIGARAGAPKPDVGTPEALKQTLLRAKSITYAEEGASRAYVEKLFEKLGIVEAMKPKIVMGKVAGEPQKDVGKGKAELLVVLVSEILPYHDLAFVGSIPAELRGYVFFTAGINAHSANAVNARKVIELISAPAAAAAFRAKGIEQH